MEKTKKAAVKPAEAVTTEDSKLPEKIFNVPVNTDLLAQYLRVYFANQRAGNASTKTKGEVSGGGRKPWRQKGTGRARQGSIRAPQWVGGGVVHGPKPKDWSLYLPSKMKRGALLSALSLKAQAGKVDVWDNFSFGKESKTKDLVKKMGDLNLGGKVLFIRTKGEEDLVRVGRNLPMVEIEAVDSLNAFSVARVKRVVLSKVSLTALEKFITKTA
ncbi:MAG: 50S ribosomal protein L4 [Patescibacteria group bacterium]